MKLACLTFIILLTSLFFLPVKAQESSVSVGGEVRPCELTIKLTPELKYSSNTYIFYNQNGVEVFRFTADSDDKGITKVDLCTLGFNVQVGNYTILVQQQSGDSQSFTIQNAFSNYSTVITLNLSQDLNYLLLGGLCCCCPLLILLLLFVLIKRRRHNKTKNHSA